MADFPKSLAAKLEQREQQNALRSLQPGAGLIDFSSNDYLGFSCSANMARAAREILQDYEVKDSGSTGSRLITGNHELYAIAEKHLADFHRADDAIIFNSGYDANVGLFSSIPQKGDVVLYDEYIHASIRDGIRLSNASAYKFRHNDIAHLEALLKKAHLTSGSGEVYVVSESVFSMDGDSPDVAAMSGLCSRYNAHFIVDEAHAVGIFGNTGEGLVQALGLQDKVFARVVTFGKSLGCHGATILGPETLKQYLVNFARSFIYTTALPPHSLAAILAAYKHLMASSSETNALKEVTAHFKKEIKRLNLDCFIASDSAIHCAVIPGNEKVRSVSGTLQQQGFDVRAILSPTVPAGQERLRFCLHSFNTPQQVTHVLELLKRLLQ